MSHLYSAKYPDNYPLEIECTWFVYSAIDAKIMLQFEDFLTEKNHDTLAVGSGHNATKSSEIVSLSYHWTPMSVIVGGGAMWVRFVSSRSVVKRGFHVTFRQVVNQGRIYF